MNKTEIIFYLNGKYKNLMVEPDVRVLDVIRENEGLLGTKEGCSDGDCGACTIVIGKLENNKFSYKAVDSCLLPAAKLQNSSVITIEGLKDNQKLNIIQEKMVEEHGAQCGFCTPGVIMSFFALFASVKNPSYSQIKAAIEGNICRCTGYESIRNTAYSIIDYINNSEKTFDLVPSSLRYVEKRLLQLKSELKSEEYRLPSTINDLKNDLINYPNSLIVSGFTDIGVRKHNFQIQLEQVIDLSNLNEIKIIEERSGGLFIGANIPLQDIFENELICNKLPIISEMLSQMASKQVRNVATLGGNICNASPIGDSVVLLMALNADLILLSKDGSQRSIQLRKFYTGYKKMAKKDSEVVIGVLIPSENYKMNHSFIKTGKRNAVDIASVNSSSRMLINENKVVLWEVSFGGIYETVVCEKLRNISLESSINEIEELAIEVSNQFNPLSDVRGSSEFRTLLIQGHLVKHFIKQTSSKGNNNE